MTFVTLHSLSLPCSSDEMCYTILLNMTRQDSDNMNINIPHESVRCYADLGYLCDCSQVYAWDGKLCNNLSQVSASSSMLFLAPLLLSLFTLCYRARVLMRLHEMKLLHMNTTNISISLSLLSLMSILLISFVYIIIYRSPSSMSIDSIKVGDISSSSSTTPAKRMLVTYLSMGITSLSVFGVFVSADALFVIFADSFRMGVTRRNRWKKYYFGGTLLTCIDIQIQVMKHILCKIDVAAGRRHSDIIRQADEASKKSSRNVLGELSQTRSMSFDSQASGGFRWPMPKGMRKLTRDDSFNSQLGYGRDTSASEAMDRTRTHSALDLNEPAAVTRKDLSFANKRYSEKIVRFLCRVFIGSFFISCSHSLTLASFYLGSASENKHDSNIQGVSETALWKSLLFVGFALTENAVLWFVADAAKSRIKHETETKQRALTLHSNLPKTTSGVKKASALPGSEGTVKAENLSPLSSHPSPSGSPIEGKLTLPSPLA